MMYDGKAMICFVWVFLCCCSMWFCLFLNLDLPKNILWVKGISCSSKIEIVIHILLIVKAVVVECLRRNSSHFTYTQGSMYCTTV